VTENGSGPLQVDAVTVACQVSKWKSRLTPLLRSRQTSDIPDNPTATTGGARLTRTVDEAVAGKASPRRIEIAGRWYYP